jgi:hypothetical protein
MWKRLFTTNAAPVTANPRVFFEVTRENKPLGRIVMEVRLHFPWR